MAQAHLKSTISLNRTAFEAGIRSIQGSVAGLNSRLTSAFRGAAMAAGGIALAVSGIKLAKFAKQALDFKDALKDAGFSIDDIKTRMRGFSDNLIQKLSPALTKIFDAINSVPFEGLGRKLGEALQTGVNVLTNAIQEGKVGELIGLSVQTGLATAGDFLIGAIKTGLEIIGPVLGRIFSSDFFSAIVIGFAGVGKMLSGILIEAFQKPLQYLSAGLAFGAKEFGKLLLSITNPLLGALGKKLIESSGMDQSFSEFKAAADSFFNSSTAKQLRQEGSQLLGESGGAMASVGSDVGKIIADKIRDFAPSDVLGSKGLQEKLTGLIDSLNKGPMGEALKKFGPDLYFKPGEDEEFGKERKMPSFQAASSLERIGAIIPGNQQSVVSHARDTATATKKIGVVAEKIFQQLERMTDMSDTNVGVYGV